ncbi:glutathione S-transferase family protein [Rhodospirillum sp. A1_3_36]|uniref:glutathione S-transferase family protein n=1 Tax=Rhodospirillum sp. A1_3_36 TaxID=3391666 RepID=UPI0039A590F3
MILHDFLESGNGYKVRLLLHWLQQPFTLVEHDILKGATRTPEFLSSKNPNGRIPALELDDDPVSPGPVLWESNAILNYLAEGTPYLPTDRLARARVLQWQFFEQYSHEPYIAVARFMRHFQDMTPERTALLETEKLPKGYVALNVMEKHLSQNDWFVGTGPTIADISLFAYTHVAPEGGFDLTRTPAILSWIARMEALPHHVAITSRATP